MMDESLAALSDPRLDLASLMCEAITAIRLYLYQPDLPLHARLSGISHVVDELCPPPGPGDCAMPGVFPPGVTAAQVAETVAGMLAGHPSPATALLERLAGESVWFKLAGVDFRTLDDTGRRRLHTRPGTIACVRTGHLVTRSGVAVAATSLTVLPSLLPPAVLAQMGGDIPFGTLAAANGGMTRRARAATAAGGEVTSTALLEVGGQLAGYASERIPAGFCEHLAALSAARPARPGRS